MISLSPKLKVLIAVAVVLIVGIVVAVIAVVVTQKTKVATIKSLAFADTNVTMFVGDEETLSVSIDPQNAKNQQLTFSSSNGSVVQVVSTQDASVVVRAVGIGEATIYVQSVANKNVTDSCHIVVNDVVADSILCERVDCFVGQSIKTNVTLQPTNSNYNKLFVQSFDDEHLSYASIEFEDGKAKLCCLAKTAGTSQVVLAFTTQTQQGESIILTKAVIVTSQYESVGNLLYQVKSEHVVDYVQPNNNDVFVIPSSSYWLNFRFFADELTNELDSHQDVNIVFDDNLLSVKQGVDSVKGIKYVQIQEKSDAPSWTTTAVQFSYAGVVRTISLNKIEFSSTFNDFGCELKSDYLKHDINDYYELKLGQAYQLLVPQQYQRLIDLGLAKLSIAENSNIATLAGNMLMPLKTTNVGELNVVSIDIDPSGSYWDKGVIAGLSNSSSINVKILDIVFE